jgi:hypothetical protein
MATTGLKGKMTLIQDELSNQTIGKNNMTVEVFKKGLTS